MARTTGEGVGGPLFIPATPTDDDLLSLAECLMSLTDNQHINKAWNNKNALAVANNLILLDIARSLRNLCDAPAIRSCYRDKYAKPGEDQC